MPEGTAKVTTACSGSLVAVTVGLEGALLGDVDVVSLLLGQDGELGVELVEVEAGHHFVEVLGEVVHLAALVLTRVALGPESDLGESLAGEGVGHHEGRVASGAAKVEQAALGEDDDSVAVGEDVAVALGLDLDALDAFEGGEASHVDFVVEVTDVADDGVVLHLSHVLGHDDVLVAGGGDEDVDLAHDIVEADDLEALHARLQGADGVDLRNVDDGALGTHGHGATFADVAVAADKGLLAGEHDVSGAHDAVGEGVLAAVQVVELGLGDAVVDVDGGEHEFAGLLHLVETVDAGGGLLRDALDAGGHVAPLTLVLGDLAGEEREDDLELGVVGGGGVGEGAVGLVLGLELCALVDEEGHVTSVIDDEVGADTLAIVFGPGHGAEGALPVLLEGLALPGEHSGGAVAGDGGSSVVLGGEDVARAPADVGAEGLHGLDEDGGLDGHVERTSNAGTLEGLVGVLGAARNKTGHLDLGELDVLATEVGKRNVGYFVVSHCCRRVSFCWGCLLLVNKRIEK